MGWFSKKKKDAVKPAAPVQPAAPARPVRQADTRQQPRPMTEEQARRFAQALHQFMDDKK